MWGFVWQFMIMPFLLPFLAVLVMPGWRSLSICVVLVGAPILWGYADVQASFDFPINDPGIESLFARMLVYFAGLGYACGIALRLAIMGSGGLYRWLFAKRQSHRTRSWRSNIRFALVGLLPVTLLVSAPFMLTYFGFCMSEFRYVSAGERIRAAIELVLEHRLKREAISGKNGVSRKAIGVFQNTDDFLAANPNCCSIGRYGGDLPAPTVFTELTGTYSSVVRVRYEETFVDQTGLAGMKQVAPIVGFDVCGKTRSIGW